MCDEKLFDDDLTRKFHATISAFFETKYLIWIYRGSNMLLSAKLRKFARTTLFLGHTAEICHAVGMLSSAPLWLLSLTHTVFGNDNIY